MDQNKKDILSCLCGSSEYRLAYKENALLSDFNKGAIIKCLKCSLERTTPRPIVQANSLNELYQNRDYFTSGRFDSKLWIGMQQMYINEIMTIKPEGSWLDIGTGMGFLVYCARENGYECEGVDLNESVVEEGKNLLNVPLSTKDVFSYPDNSFDIISLSHVIEHIENPKEFLNSVSAKLKQGGAIMVAVPNIKGGVPFLLRLLNRLNFKKGGKWLWQGYQLEQHLWHFDPDTIKQIVPKHMKIASLNFRNNMFYGFTKIRSLKYRILTILFSLSRIVHSGDNIIMVLRK